MNTTVEALRELYVALGGDIADVQDCVTNVEVLNVIAAKYGCESDASLNADAVTNIAAVADQIGYPEPSGTKNITANGRYDVKNYEEANVNVNASVNFATVAVKNNSGIGVTIYNPLYATSSGQISVGNAIDISNGATKNVNVSGVDRSGTFTPSYYLQMLVYSSDTISLEGGSIVGSASSGIYKTYYVYVNQPTLTIALVAA